MDDNQSALLEVVKYELNSPILNKDRGEVTDDTILSDILSDTDGIGASNSKNIFESAIRFTIDRNNLPKKDWPAAWISLTVRQFCESVVIFLLLLFPFAGSSQVVVNISASKTELKNSALTVALSYVRSVDSVISNKTYFWAGKHSSFLITPDINIETGTSDAFSSITAKITGLGMVFKTKQIGRLIAPDLHKGFHTFPISVGMETNNQFSFINGIIEAGWVPWIKSLSTVKVGMFLQAGNKFKTQSIVDTTNGGRKDESAEAVGDLILRQRGFITINSPNLLTVNFFKLGFIGSAYEWYDMANGGFYYKLQATLRTFLNDGSYVDFVYMKGSGAPLFNTGNQFGLGLTLIF